MSSHARHRDHDVARKRFRRTVSLTSALVVMALVISGFFVYRHLDGNITALDTTEALGSDRPDKVTDAGPHEPLNILLLGSDSREGLNSSIGGESPGLSDTTILLHLSASRDRAYGVSLPRDAMVQRPDCMGKNGEIVPGDLDQFNKAYAIGGPGCTQKTVEQLTGVRIDHFVVVDFSGFKGMVNALGGVPVCVPREVNDTHGNIHLDAGSYEVTGDQALDYVRVRSAISDNGDIGRMARQQAFLASMANKAISAGTLVNPKRLISFLDAATESLTTDPELASLKNLAGLANELRGIGLDQIQFLTVPWESWVEDPNRVVWAPESKLLWRRMRLDEPLTPKQAQEVTTAADAPTATRKPSSKPSADTSPDPVPTPSPGAVKSPTPTAKSKAQRAEENGLCA